METRENILQELKQISEVVANLSTGNIYTVPTGYFDGFSASVLARIQAENADFGVKTTPFGVPKGYFDDLAGNILNRIKQQEQSVEEELNELAPILNTISKKPVYTVPEGYFESLEITIPMKVANPTAEVFGFSPKRILQYAVAACTAGILMIGAYLYTNQTSSQDGGAATAAIPYDSALKMNVNQELASVNVQEIEQYLNEAPGVGYSIGTSSSPDEIEIDEYIKSVSDDEIKEYLDETAEPAKSTTGT